METGPIMSGSGRSPWCCWRRAGAFIVWLARLGEGEQNEYDIFFKQSVGGLAKGSAGHLRRACRSGQVSEIELWKKDPEFVRVRIKVDERRADPAVGTTATIQGSFTGVSTILLDGARARRAAADLRRRARRPPAPKACR